MKNNQGITTMQIVITVIVMLILLSIAIFYGQGTSKEATISALYNEIREVSSAIQEASALNQIKVSGEEIIFFGETSAQKVEKTAYAEQLVNAGEGEFYYLDFTTSKDLKHTLELENVKNDYILNFNTLKLYLKDGISLTDESGNEELKYSAEEIIYYYKNVFDYTESPKGTYLITYNTNGGSGEIADQSAPIGISITITSQRPTREGYAFMGWSKSSGETNVTYLPGQIYKFSGNTTLYAVWKESDFDASVIMSGYQYRGTKSVPRIEGETNGGTVTYYYNTIDSNQNGTLWSKVTTSTSLDAGTYYMYATVLKDGVTLATPTTAFTISKANGSINYIDKAITKSLNDDSFKNILNQDGDGKVKYTSSNLSVATVASNGVVTIVDGGKTTITAEVEDGTNYTYTTKTASYELTVTKSNLSATVNMNDYVYAGEMSQPTVTGNLENGDVKYYYSDTNQNSNGAIWNNMTSTSLNARTYYMYAVIAETANYGEFTTQPVEFTVEKAEGTLKFEDTILEKKTTSETFVNKLTNTGDGNVSYTSSNTSVATVDENGKVTIIDEGETTITATVSNGTNYTYTFANSAASYTLKVEVPVYYLMQRNSKSSTTYAIGSLKYKASDISTITFEDKIPEGYVSKVGNDDTIWDVSRDGDKTVLAWVTVNSEDSTKYDLHIGADIGEKGKIMAPENSESLFSGYSSCTEINDLKFLDTSNVKNMSNMFCNCRALTELDVTKFVTSNVTDMNEMFDNCVALTELDVTKFVTSNVTNMNSMFYNCSGLTSLDLSSFNTGTVTGMRYMFYNCSGLTSLDVSSFNTGTVADMGHMFDNCVALTELDVSGFDTSKVTNMSGMFYFCSGLISLDLSSFDTSKVTNMSGMFYFCSGLISLDLSSFNTGTVTDMGHMFDNCVALTELDVTKFVTSNVTNMNSMFYNCSGLTSLDLSSFNTGTVADMGYMFYNCSGLASLTFGKNFDTSSATNMGGMFYSCSGLRSLDLSNFDTSSATNMRSMFYSCSGLRSLDLSNFNTSKVTDMCWMFFQCRGLTSLDLSNFNTSKVTDMQYMFYWCSSLTILKLGASFDKLDGSSMFYGCNSLTTIITTRTENPIALGTSTGLNSNCILYVLGEKVERAFETAENYLTVFGSDSDVLRDDGTTDIYRIRTIMELVGDSEVSVEVGNTYGDQGVKVAGMTANDDGTYTPFGYTVSSSIKDRYNNAVDSIDTSKIGKYIITYTLTNSSGEIGMSIERIVRVTTIHSVANGPYLNTSEMKAVYWDESGEEMYDDSFLLSSEGNIYNTTLYNYDFDDDAYEIKEDTYDINWNIKPRWANAMTKDDGSYWVWIPRYAYKITYYSDPERTTVSKAKTQYGYIDVIFLYGTSNDEFKDKQGNIRELPDDYTVHPAFQAMSSTETTKNPLGKWDKELEGIWVAKYEASQEILTTTESGEEWITRNVTSTTTGKVLTTNAGNTGKTEVRVVSKPSVMCWGNTNISYIYTNCLNMNTALYTHQMKNSEWGAVAYLTYSVYGRNGNELSVNRCNNYYTGAGVGIKAEDLESSSNRVYGNSRYDYDSETFESTYSWKTEPGKLASTTGNVYGIYDMSGGAWEYVASYLNNGHANLQSFAKLLVNGEAKYKQVYTSTATGKTDAEVADYAKNKNIYGDAVWEVSTTSQGYANWCEDFSDFPDSYVPFFIRGGVRNNGSAAGIFYFSDACSESSAHSFRPVICITSSD